MIGINLSGAEFGKGSVYGKHYIYPTATELDYYASKGVELIRFPFKWERMQTKLGGELSKDELSRMKTFLDQAAERGMKVIIDLHNFGRYGGKVVGTADVPSEKFASFWNKLAAELKDSKALIGYDIMNEPHDMGANNSWPKLAQAAIDAIRKVDGAREIYVEGTAWSTASTWKKFNSELAKLKDPSNKLIFEAHQYFDKNGSGTYSGTYDSEGAYENIGVDRVKPFLDWLAENNLKGFIGEFSVPDNDPRWLNVLSKFLTALDQADVDATYWGAGSWWGKYPMGINPRGGVDQPQMDVLRKFMSDQHSAIGVDVMRGGQANDVYVVNNAKDIVDETKGGGIDLVYSTINIDLSKTTQFKGNVENVTLVGNAGKAVGNSLANILIGNDTSNTLVGGSGADRLEGKGGGDRIDGGTGSDTASYETSRGGIVASLANIKLNTGDARGDQFISIENLSGSSFSDKLYGDNLANVLTGAAGNDYLSGYLGNDKVEGGAGADTLIGGLGSDTFVFRKVSDSTMAVRDVIKDFRHGDVIDVHMIDAKTTTNGDQAFKFIEKHEFSHSSGELRYTTWKGSTYVYGDVNGDGDTDFSIKLDGALALTKYDFIL